MNMFDLEDLFEDLSEVTFSEVKDVFKNVFNVECDKSKNTTTDNPENVINRISSKVIDSPIVLFNRTKASLTASSWEANKLPYPTWESTK